MKKLLVMLLMLIHTISFAEEDVDVDAICVDIYSDVQANFIPIFKQAKLFRNKLSVNSDEEATRKMLSIMKLHPEALKEISYSMGGASEDEVKTLINIAEHFFENTKSIFFDTRGRLRDDNGMFGAWRFQCSTGKLDSLFEYLDSVDF